MKILYINSLYSPLIKGGAELSLQLIVEGMKSLGHEVVVASLHPEPAPKVDELNGVKVYRVPLENAYWPYLDTQPSTLAKMAWHARDRKNLTMGKKIRQILKDEQPSVVSCHNLAGWSIAVWDEIYALGVPIIQVLHDFYLLCPNSNMNKAGIPCEDQCMSCQLLRYSHAKNSSKVSAVVGISQSILNRFTSAGYFSQASKQVIYNVRTAPEPQPPRVRKPREKLILGYLGTVSKVKGVAWLIDQFQKLSIPRTLKIAGKGDDATLEEFRALAKISPVEFVGYVKPNEFLKTIDILVVPSLWEEPLGMVAIEALANGIPVITSGKGGLSESVKHEKNGLICSPEQPNSLGEAIVRIYDYPSLYNRLSAAASFSVSHFLDKSRLISEYSQVIQETKSKKFTD
ncbi:glycosyltransferase family 4 protein [Algoriphagus jejuensis]|uniref:Glycosyltransferase family 4 protein n=1 Tax=Algoriphagus jejuensis TaxID=419934 RepID=A0ABN1N3I7_9BACT